MFAQQTELSCDFLFAKVHGIWARAVTGADLGKLIRGGRRDDLARLLTPRGIDITNRGDVQKRLTAHLIADLARVMRLADGRVGAFYRAFLDRFHFENLKALLRYHTFPGQEVDISMLLIDSGHLPALDLPRLRDAASTHQFFQALPESPWKERLLPILVELADSRDLFAAESRLDILYYELLSAAVARLGRSWRVFADRFVRTEIDIVNLIIALRNDALYALPAATLRDLFVAGGRHGDDRLLDALAAAEPGRSARLLPAEYRAVLEPLAGMPLYLSENALWQCLYDQAEAAFRDYNRPPGSVIAFTYLKWFEALNLSRVFEGLHFSLDAQIIDSMMVGTGHV